MKEEGACRNMKMATIVLALVFIVALVPHKSFAWESAHATFYGDMSGAETMRMSFLLLFSTLIYIIRLIQMFTC